jgi:urease accessory protein
LAEPAPNGEEAARQRSQGRVAVEVVLMSGRSVVRRVAEGGPSRLRLPTTRDGSPEGVIINTAGGLASGDTIAVEATLGPGAELVLTSAAAEKVYRSTGPETRVETRLTVGPGARLEWLPQETILFNRCRFRRDIAVELDPDSAALLLEATVFGRQASGEVLASGSVTDRWRVRRGGRLVYADALRLQGPVAAILDRPSVAAGRTALATLLYVAPDAQSRLDAVREHLAACASECGASAWNGLMLVRWLAPEVATLRRDLARFMTEFRGRPLPRVWQT